MKPSEVTSLELAERNLDDSCPLKLAPVSVLEFAQIALDAGGTRSCMSPSSISNPVCVPVPGGVLSVLPGPGTTTGKGLVSHPLIRKVDITVTRTILAIWHDSERILRQALIQGVH